MNTIRNFRDLSGTKTSRGIVKKNVLLRGGPLFGLSHDAITKLGSDYNMTAIVDFRNNREIDNEPDQAFENAIYHHIRIIEEEDKKSADPNHMIKEGRDRSTYDFMVPLYEAFVTSDYSRKAYKRFLEVLADNSTGATYFHCTAGKDRTGFGAALVLGILGADRDTIMKDYLETNVNVMRDKDTLIASIQKTYGFTNDDDDIVLSIIGVKDSYLNASYAKIDEIYGDFDTFIRDGLEISSETLEKLRSNLLE